MRNARFRVNIDRPDAFRLTSCAKATNIVGMHKARVGDIFGHLKVIGVAGNGRFSNRLLCQCVCGNQVWYSSSHLVGGRRKTCGCRIKTLLSNQPDECKKLVRVIGVYKKQARTRNVAWELPSEVAASLLNGNCHYCGSKPNRIVNNGKGAVYGKVNGIDRKNNSEGYTAENSVTCCVVCNHAKHTLSYESFINHVKAIHNNLCK